MTGGTGDTATWYTCYARLPSFSNMLTMDGGTFDARLFPLVRMIVTNGPRGAFQEEMVASLAALCRLHNIVVRVFDQNELKYAKPKRRGVGCNYCVGKHCSFGAYATDQAIALAKVRQTFSEVQLEADRLDTVGIILVCSCNLSLIDFFRQNSVNLHFLVLE